MPQWSGRGSSGVVVVVVAAEVAEDFSWCHVVVTGFPLLDGTKFLVFSFSFLVHQKNVIGTKNVTESGKLHTYVVQTQ